MSNSFSLRAMTTADSAGLAALAEQSPDGGAVTFGPRFHLPAYEAYTARHHDMLGVVAEANGTSGLVGAAYVSFGQCQFEGSIRPYALLSALMVHPNHRRQGIAAALAAWRVDHAIEHSGSETILLADIQTGNVGSIANAKKWTTQIGGDIITSPTPMRTKPPRAESDIIVREATSDELETLVARLNAFYQDYNFYRPQTVDSLRSWLQESPFTTPINHYVVAVDRANRLLAGMGIREEGRLMSFQIEKVPPLIKFANIFLKVVPSDGDMRTLATDYLWFDQLEAARYLWQTVRWEYRDRGSNLLCEYDPRSPITQILQTPPWMPTTSLSIALRAPVPMDEARLISPII